MGIYTFVQAISNSGANHFLTVLIREKASRSHSADAAEEKKRKGKRREREKRRASPQAPSDTTTSSYFVCASVLRANLACGKMLGEEEEEEHKKSGKWVHPLPPPLPSELRTEEKGRPAAGPVCSPPPQPTAPSSSKLIQSILPPLPQHIFLPCMTAAAAAAGL